MLATLYQRGWVPDVTMYTSGVSKIPGLTQIHSPNSKPVNPSGKMV